MARLQGAVVASTQCFGTSGRLEGSLALDAEGAYVDATRLCVTPTQVLGCYDEGRLVSQSVTQVVQLAAQVGQRLCVGRVPPERFGDALPGLGSPAWATRKATSATVRGDRVRTMPVAPSVIACSPKRETCSISSWPPEISG